MKTLKIISILSFLFIVGLQQNGYPILFMLVLFAYQFINDLFSFQFLADSWKMGISLPIIGVIIFYRSLSNKSFYVNLSCFILFIFAAIYFTGIWELQNWRRFSLWFFIPSLIFFVSSILVLVKSYKKI